MDEMLSYCGFRCDLCPAYRENVSGPEHQRRIAAGWKLLYGLDVAPEDVYCDGCLDMRREARRVDSGCKMRVCVLGRGLDSCAQCGDYPCREVRRKTPCRPDVECFVGRALTEEEYRLFLQPYEVDLHRTPRAESEKTGDPS